MAPIPLTIWVKDGGFYRKDYLIRPGQRLKTLLREYRSRLCAECTDGTLLEFWFEATQVRGSNALFPWRKDPLTDYHRSKIEDHHTPSALGMGNDDVIDVRISQQHTRGTCPGSAEQALPNIHYAVEENPEVPASGSTSVSSTQVQGQDVEGTRSTMPKRFKVTVKDQKDFRLEFTLKPHSRFGPVIEEFCRRTGRSERLYRFLHEEARVLADSTPESVSSLTRRGRFESGRTDEERV